MNLHAPLLLAEAKLLDVGLTPTSRFFKPVLHFQAPCDRDQAAQLGCEFLFDKHNNPIAFDGQHRPHGELPGAMVSLGVTTTILLQSEKVAHFAFQRIEKKGLVVQCRIHISEDQDLHKLLDFLADINKQPMLVTIKDAQISILETVQTEGWPAADSNGNYDERRAKLNTFSKGKLKAYIRELQLGEDSYIASWSIAADLKSGQIADGEVLDKTRQVFDNAIDARRKAAASLLESGAGILKLDLTAAETKAVGFLQEWCEEHAPGLSAAIAKAEGARESVQ